MSVLGQQIKKYRLEKGLTQEQLGKQLGVTTQAVSKWECGGVPDAELLPRLSEVLCVSIDALFGREEQSVTFSLTRKLSQMRMEEAFQYAFDLCWSMMLGVHKQTPFASDEYLRTFLEGAALDKEIPPWFSKIYYDHGMMNARIQPDFCHFFLMLEPKSSLRSHFPDIEGIRQVFSVLADSENLRILFYLYTRLNTPIAASLISQNTGLPIPEIDRRMETLCQHGLIKRTAIAAAEGQIYSYMFAQEDAVVALLCLADEIRYCEEPNMLWSIDRCRPIMDSTSS